MNFVDLKKQSLSKIEDDITYIKEFYILAKTVTGTDTDESHEHWLVDTPYTTGQYCIVPELKSIYRATEDNEGKFPLAASNSSWVFWGFINSCNMFACDENIGSKTTGTDIVITLDFSNMNTLALLDINFSSVQIKQVNNSDASIVKDLTISGVDIACGNFAQYCYSHMKHTKKIIVDDLEWLPDSTVTITFTGDVSIGTLVSGILEDLGITLMQTSLSWQSKSKISVDQFSGFRTVTRKAKIRILKAKVILKTEVFNHTAQRIDEILDTNILFVPTKQDEFSELITIGYLEAFTMPVNNAEIIETTANIIGVAS